MNIHTEAQRIADDIRRLLNSDTNAPAALNQELGDLLRDNLRWADKEEIDALKEQLDDKDDEIDRLDSDVSRLELEVDSLEGTVARLKETVGHLGGGA